MKKLLIAKLLVLTSLFVFTNCSKDDTATPDLKSPETLVATKWNWVSYGDETGDEISIEPEKPVSIRFIDESNIERTAFDENGQSIVTQVDYQISKDTLIAFEKTEVNYFLLKEHTSTNLTLSRVKHVDRSTNEVSATSTTIFKYNKSAN